MPSRNVPKQRLKGPKPIPLHERFFAKVAMIPFHTCWEWLGTTSNGGYGTLLHSKKRKEFAHRISWELHYGEIPPGMRICHKCDNVSCVNPDHLFMGTARDNTLDMIRKGRHRPARRPICERGHVKYFNGRRLVCRECAQAASKKSYARKKLALKE